MRLSSKKIVLALAAMLVASSSASAMVLWDQSVITPAGAAIPNSNSPGFGGFVAHSVNDVTVPASGWHVTKISEWYGFFNSSWTGITQGFIYVQPKTGGLPTIAPVAVQSPMSAALDPAQSALLGQSVLKVSANVNLNLSAGDYWIGITPSASAGINGANLQWPSAQVGDAVATYQSGAWSHPASLGNEDGAFLIEGDVTVPVTPATWGSIKSLY